MGKFIPATGKLPDNVTVFEQLQDGLYLGTVRLNIHSEDLWWWPSDDEVAQAVFEKGLDNFVSPDVIVDKVVAEDPEGGSEPLLAGNLRSVSPGGNLEYFTLTPEIAKKIITINGEDAFRPSYEVDSWLPWDLVSSNKECAEFYQSLKAVDIYPSEESDKSQEPRNKSNARRDSSEFHYDIPSNEAVVIVSAFVGDKPIFSGILKN